MPVWAPMQRADGRWVVVLRAHSRSRVVLETSPMTFGSVKVAKRHADEWNAEDVE